MAECGGNEAKKSRTLGLDVCGAARKLAFQHRNFAGNEVRGLGCVETIRGYAISPPIHGFGVARETDHPRRRNPRFAVFR